MIIILSLVLFFLVFCYISYQEIRFRKVQNYLILLIGIIGISNVIITSNISTMLLFVTVVTGMLGIARAGGTFSTADWLCISALFAFLTPFGIHVSVFVLLLGFVTAIIHHLIICVCSNVINRTTFPGIYGSKWTRLVAFVSCKERGYFDRFAYPAISEIDGVVSFDFKSGINGKKMDHTRRCQYVLPAIPILTHMCGVTFFVTLVLFPQSVF